MRERGFGILFKRIKAPNSFPSLKACKNIFGHLVLINVYVVPSRVDIICSFLGGTWIFFHIEYGRIQ